MSETTIDKFAPDASTQDLRVQTLAYTDASLSTNFAVEDRAMVDVVNIGDSAKRQKKVEMESGETAGFPAVGEDALRQAGVEFVGIRDDVAETDDRRAASDILLRRADEQLLAVVEARRKLPTRYSRSFQIFRSFRLIAKPDPVADPAAHEKFIRYSNVQAQKDEYLATRFATTQSFSDILKKKEEGASKELAGAVQAKVPYDALP